MNAGESFTNNYILDVLKIMDSASKQSLTLISYEEDEDLAAYL